MSAPASMPGVNSIVKYAQLVSDPCHGPLVRGVADNGLGQILERVRTTTLSTDAVSASNGYVIWFPSYHHDGGNGAAGPVNLGNYYIYTNATSSTVPSNTVSAPMGTGSISTTGVFLRDPAFNVISQGAVFSRARTLSACLQLEYVGALNLASGQVAMVSNISLAAFNSLSGAASTFTPLSIDEMFAYAGHRERVQIAGHEVVWRPSDKSSVPRTDGSTTLGGTVPATQVTRPDAVFDIGNATSTSTEQVCVDPSNTYGICVAWRGFPATANVVSIQAVKVIDCELAARNNAIEPMFMSDPKAMPDPVATVTSWLDRNTPGWQVRMMNATTNFVGSLATAYAPRLLGGNVMRGVRGRMLLADNP